MVSEKIKRFMVQGGWIRRMFDEGIALKQKVGEKNVFDLSLGNPVAEPPDEFRRELVKWATNSGAGLHRYMPNAGYPETRSAVARHLSSVTGLPFTADEIIMTCGAAGAINVVLKSITEPGDEVILFSPFFSEYPYYVDNHQGVSRPVPTGSDFMPDSDLLARHITARTRAVLVNSPNNPTGVVYSHDVLAAIGRTLQKKEREYGSAIFLISDDVYRRLVFNGTEPPYVFQYHNRSVVATSHSKDLALPGERIGYAAVNPGYEQRRELVDAMVFCNRVMGFVNAPALMQHVVRGLQGAGVDVAEYRRKRDLLYHELTSVGYSMVKPEGAFYMFPRSPLPDDVSFVRELRKYNVLTVPGVGFGTPGYFRLSYCVDDWVIEGALRGFKAAAREFGLS